MIVVAIIALLAAIAVPGFLRARKRSQATAILNDCRVIDGAKDQYAIENNKPGSATPGGSDLAPYIKPGTRLYNVATAAGASQSGIKDLLGNNYQITTVDTPIKVSSTSISNFSDVINSGATASAFWGAYIGS